MKKFGSMPLLAMVLALVSVFGAHSLPAAPSSAQELKPTIERQVEALLSRMTLEEKVGQMTQADRCFLKPETDITTYALGSLLSGGGSAPKENKPAAWGAMVDQYQELACKTRLQIPLLYGIDAVHGHNNVIGAVVFPHNIGLGATRDPALVEQIARITALEVAGTGMHWAFAPCVAVGRDERWGRTYESFGEDPALVASLGAAAVRGLQGSDLAHPDGILASVKHFVGDGGTTNGEDQGNTKVDEPTLRSVHLPGYIAALAAGARNIMTSYSSWNGNKMHGHRYLMNKVLKGELGFTGFIISDWKGIDQLSGEDYKESVALGINAGIDMVMVPEDYRGFITALISLVQEGRVPMSRIDDAVRRILRVKFEMGLWKRLQTDPGLTAAIGTPEHRDVARQAVRESLVVLQNKDGFLPLSPKVRKLAVVGPLADDIGGQCGGWTISWQGALGRTTEGTTILEGIRGLLGPETSIVRSLDGNGITGCDAAVVVIGEKPYAEFQGDRKDLSLPVESMRILDTVSAAHIPNVAVLLSGRPLLIGPALSRCNGVVAAWFPGSEGAGVADVLFGRFAPTGKLSVSWPATMGQIPINLGDKRYAPLFPYGHGLSWNIH
ncbi:MAG: glycoside hydrolase family 3 N-terminal domain-containing protein [Candidatus Ozemobacteraceae bacterium]